MTAAERLKHQADALQGLADLLQTERQSTLAAASLRACRALEKAEEAMRNAASLLLRDSGRVAKAVRRKLPARTSDDLPLCWKYPKLPCLEACQRIETPDACLNDPN